VLASTVLAGTASDRKRAKGVSWHAHHPSEVA
jgi:hypothetical protein